MLRKLALSLAIAGALSATQANALGLGEIQVNSALNEPLDAEIRLLEVRDLSPLQIQPRMADIDEFSLAGISKSSFLTNVDFDVQVSPDGTGRIRITSSAPIREPFLNFLVEVNWPSGRLVREYTLLLDPPVFDTAPTPSRIQPAQARPAPQPVQAVTQTEPQLRAPAGAPAASNIRTRMDPQSEIYVDVDDTLWKLAMAHRPDSSISAEQMMLALQRKNPESFPSGNINMLKAGTVMKLPGLEEIRQLSKAQARAEVARQTQAWRSGRLTGTAETAPAPVQGSEDAGKPAEAEPAAPAEADGQLKVVTPQAENAAGEPEQTGDVPEGEPESAEALSEDSVEGQPSEQEQMLAERNEELENRLLLTQESVAKVERENTELNEKIDAIASQIDKLQRLVELKDRELALMQQRLDQQATEQAPEQPGLMDRLLQGPVYIAGLIVAAVAFLLGLLFARRRKDAKPEQADADADEPESPEPQDSDTLPDMAVAGAAIAGAGAAAAVAVAAADEDDNVESVAEEPVVTEPNQTDEALDDLDLDMDLDLDDEAAGAGLAEGETVSDEEFDLGVDEDLTLSADRVVPKPLSAVDEGDEVDTALDDILGSDSVAQSDVAPETDAFDNSLDDLLGEGAAVAETAEAGSDASADTDQDDELGDLDFAVDAFDTADDSSETVIDLPEDLEFDVSDPKAGAEATVAETDSDDLTGLSFATAETAQDGQPPEAEQEDFLDDFFAEDEVDSADEFARLDDASDDDVSPLTDEALEIDTGENKLNLEIESEVPDQDLATELDSDLEMMLQDVAEESESEAESADDDADAPLSAPEAAKQTPGQRVEEELTANIAHDLDAEIDDLLGSTDDEIALEESNAEELFGQEDDPLESLNLLEGADEIETKLDLARAYIEMEDAGGAKDILNEIISEGTEQQRDEAQRLLDTLE